MFTAGEAGEVIDMIEPINGIFLRGGWPAFRHAATINFITAGRDFPEENGMTVISSWRTAMNALSLSNGGPTRPFVRALWAVRVQAAAGWTRAPDHRHATGSSHHPRLRQAALMRAFPRLHIPCL